MKRGDLYIVLDVVMPSKLDRKQKELFKELAKTDLEIGSEFKNFKKFKDIIDELTDNDVLVINNTKVIPARIYGQKRETGAKIEFLLLKRIDLTKSEVILKPGRKAKEGAEFIFGDGLLNAKVLKVKEDGNRIVEFSFEGVFEDILDKLGQMPLPPYIKEKLDEYLLRKRKK